MPNSGLPGTEPSDLRFQFKIIEGLSESVRQQSASTERLASAMAEMQRTQVTMLERLAKLEAKEFGEALVKVDGRVDAMDARLDALFRDKDRRDGAVGLMTGVRTWGPWVFSLFTALYLIGRSIGIVPSPPTTITKVETPISIERRDHSRHDPQATGAAP
jgi:hypothetical protein